MGAWGVTLYASDTARDVKSDFELWLRVPGTADDIVAAMTAEAPSSRDINDEDYPTFWLVLADQFHRNGIDHPETFQRARHVIESGLDLEMHRGLGLDAASLERRRAVLQGQLEAWSSRHPRPRSRKLLARPEPHAFPVGAVVVYPTDGGEPRNNADTRNRFGWTADGWGSAVILAQGHARGYFAWECIGRLSAHGAVKPTLSACVESAIENQPYFANLTGDGELAIGIGALTLAHARRMGFESVGQVRLDSDAVLQLHPALSVPNRAPLAGCYSVFTWWAEGVWPRGVMRVPGLDHPRPAAPLRSLLLA